MGRGRNSAGRQHARGGRGGRAEGDIARLHDRRPASTSGKQRSSEAFSSTKIVLEDESLKAHAASIFEEAAEQNRKLRPHTADEIFESCFGRSGAAMTRFLNRDFRGRIGLLASVGREGLGQTIQSVAVFWSVLEGATPAQRAAALAALNVKPDASAPVTRLFNNLLGLPDVNEAGKKAVLAARTRHSKYAGYVLGAPLCGVAPDQISVEARKPEGFTRFGNAYRSARRAERTQDTSDGSVDKGAQPHGQVADEVEAPGVRQVDASSSERDQITGIIFKAAPDVARPLGQVSRLSLQLVRSGDGQVELFGRVRLPRHVRERDPEAALQWVEDVITVAGRKAERAEDSKPSRRARTKGDRNG